MRERHNTKIAVFGGRPGQGIEFKSNVHVTLSILIDENTTSGMAGNQVLEWTDLDSEIKTAGLKKVRVTFNDISELCSERDLIRIPLRRRICEYAACLGYTLLTRSWQISFGRHAVQNSC